jgi:hypothetical protein
VATITPTLPDRPSGATLTGTLASGVAVAAAAGGDSIVLGGNTVMIRVINGGGGSINVTLNSVQVPSFAGGAQAADVDPVMAVAAGATRVIRIPDEDFPRFANTTTGMLDLTYSGVTSVTIEAWTVS